MTNISGIERYLFFRIFWDGWFQAQKIDSMRAYEFEIKSIIYKRKEYVIGEDEKRNMSHLLRSLFEDSKYSNLGLHHKENSAYTIKNFLEDIFFYLFQDCEECSTTCGDYAEIQIHPENNLWFQKRLQRAWDLFTTCEFVELIEEE